MIVPDSIYQITAKPRNATHGSAVTLDPMPCTTILREKPYKDKLCFTMQSNMLCSHADGADDANDADVFSHLPIVIVGLTKFE
jgi:hypothetical protein